MPVGRRHLSGNRRVRMHQITGQPTAACPRIFSVRAGARRRRVRAKTAHTRNHTHNLQCCRQRHRPSHCDGPPSRECPCPCTPPREQGARASGPARAGEQRRSGGAVRKEPSRVAQFRAAVQPQSPSMHDAHAPRHDPRGASDTNTAKRLRKPDRLSRLHAKPAAAVQIGCAWGE